MNIYGQKVVLRALELEDMQFLQEMLNDPEMERMVIGWSFPTSKKQQLMWYENIVNDKLNHRFAISYDNKFVGVSTLTKIDWKNRSANHGIKLHSSTPKGIGIATDAIYATMKYAFEELQLNRLGGSFLDYNIASQKLYEKCGWKKEGVYRQSIFKNNAYHDEYPTAILKGDYLKWKKIFIKE
ncbi:MAG: GNAT family protein [Bacteroidales bacterium]|nr:GNAT family protein [Bacteroidales bacterium]